ncbi:hypothetical protein DFH06DRAFT_1472411 [Mycena polygramma]|nr:hypothetical protein DFH06DRAFT_1472411 [Mycena polygramma]
MLGATGSDRARLAALEAQISDLERSLTALRAEKMAVQDRLDSYKYPVLTLPNEIVSEIFIHFLPIYPLYPPLRGNSSPIALTHICSAWRQVALATPQLWRAIYLSDPWSTKQRQLFEVADIWLRRSGDCPLSLFVEQIGEGYTTPDLFLAIPYRARWEHLRLTLSHPYFPTLDAPMPLLRHLHLRLGYAEPRSVIFPATFVPLLRTALLNNNAAQSVVLPWTRLTCLTLRYVEARHAVSILAETSNLVHCELLLWNDGSDEPTPDITLPCLESLTFPREGDPVTGFQHLFVVPALRKLEIQEEFLGLDPIDSLATFILKSGCKLQEVHMHSSGTIGTTPGLLPAEAYSAAFPLIPKFSFD